MCIRDSRYLERDWEVFAITRQITPELEMLSTQHALHLVSGDVCDAAFLDGLPERMRGRQLDQVINNAGIMGTESFAGTGRPRQGRGILIATNGAGCLKPTCSGPCTCPRGWRPCCAMAAR